MSDSDPIIEKGACHLLLAYEVALMVDLDKAARAVTEGTRGGLVRDRRNPAGFDYRPLPLKIVQPGGLSVAGIPVEGHVELTIFDFGAVALEYRLPLSGPFSALRRLTAELANNAALLADSRRRVQELLEAIGPALFKPSFSPFVEDYIVFAIERFQGGARPSFTSGALAPLTAQVLMGEEGQLSEQEVRDALTSTLSYAESDLAILDWNAAILHDPEPQATLAVLEYANVQLLEYRVLDEQLDLALTNAYETAVSRRMRRILPRTAARASERLAELQVDGLALFESVNNALKLLGDQFLARLYRAASTRFHLDSWERSILRKLETLESIYGKLSAEAAQRRSELLEWIIIILIAIELFLIIVPIHFR